MRKVCFDVYTFDELSDAAKEVARRWMRAALRMDTEWYDQVYEDAEGMANLLGITINPRPAHSRGGVRSIPSIWFTGFSSQGDGACFEGEYRYAPTIKAMAEAAPVDKQLNHIAFELELLQSQHRNGLRALTTQRGRYCHSSSMEVEVWHEDDEEEVSEAVQKELAGLLRAFADWIYKQLEEESDHRATDEYVDEQLRAQEFEFTIDGHRSADIE